MRCRSLALFALLGFAVTLGCGKSGNPAAGTSGSAPGDPIAMVVFEFFDAVRQGQTDRAYQRLTPLALQRITESGMNIAPPGSATASFQVGAVTQRENDHALVAITWTDLDPDGKPYNEPILCEVRDIGGGQWRICGMAQDRGPGLPPMVIDFETPAAAPAQTQTGVAQAGAAPTTGGVAPTAPAQPAGTVPVAQDPFLQPVQR